MSLFFSAGFICLHFTFLVYPLLRTLFFVALGVEGGGGKRERNRNTLPPVQGPWPGLGQDQIYNLPVWDNIPAIRATPASVVRILL